jgi:hydroxymethylpyrimidine pyrophosphatase-like HAD family hydrolase
MLPMPYALLLQSQHSLSTFGVVVAAGNGMGNDVVMFKVLECAIAAPNASERCRKPH